MFMLSKHAHGVKSDNTCFGFRLKDYRSFLLSCQMLAECFWNLRKPPPRVCMRWGDGPLMPDPPPRAG